MRISKELGKTAGLMSLQCVLEVVRADCQQEGCVCGAAVSAEF